jgi:hypothetical protein
MIATSTSRSISFLQIEAAKASSLARRYREALSHAKAVGKDYGDGTYRGPWGNAKDPESGWHYSPHIRLQVIKNELKARDLYMMARELLGVNDAPY